MTMSDRQEIIMNFGCAPSLDDILTIARSILAALPDELAEGADDLELDVQDFPDETTAMENNVEDIYDLLALYKSAKEIVPGVQKKDAQGNDALVLYRRPILDYWCESGEQFEIAVRQILIEEIATQQGFRKMTLTRCCLAIIRVFCN